MKNLITVLFLLSIFVGARSSDACSVMEGYPGTLQENYSRNDVVFVGKVTSVVQDKSVYGDYRIQFEVAKVYKGNFDKTVTVSAAGSSAACGYDDAYSQFTKGSVWAIYADTDLRTSSVVANKKYTTEKEALAELDTLQGPTVCTMQYDPFCGRKDTGIRCVTTPCDSFEYKTYGNLCMLEADNAEALYSGECRTETSGEGDIPRGGFLPGSPDPGTGTVVLPTATSMDEMIVDVPISEESSSGWKKFWEGLKSVIFFWK